MTTQDLALWLLGISLVIHTIAEAWLPEYRRVKPDWQAVVFNRPLFLENLPIFVAVMILAALGWRWPIIAGILPAIGVTHPIFDHVGLSLRAGYVRPGSWTGIFLLLPISIWTYLIAHSRGLFQLHWFWMGSAIGVAVSVWLVWTVLQEEAA